MVKQRRRIVEITCAPSAAGEDSEESLVESMPDGGIGSDFTEQSEVREWIRRSVDQLPEPGRTLFLKVVVEEVTQASAATALKMSEATASRGELAKAKAAFKRNLQAVNPELLDYYVDSRGRGRGSKQ